jgi:ferredoxin
MNLLTPPSKISQQQQPCPNCHAPTPVDVITRIESEEDLTNFIALGLNRARCSFCGTCVEALVRVSVNFATTPLTDIECVPLALLERPEVVEDLARNTPEGLHRVFSHDL